METQDIKNINRTITEEIIMRVTVCVTCIAF